MLMEESRALASSCYADQLQGSPAALTSLDTGDLIKGSRVGHEEEQKKEERNIPESVTSLATGSTLAGFNEHICS
ncbi:unnamed protein product [Lota lota]